MIQGVVKKIKTPDGYGFLTVEGRDKDLFFHATEVVAGNFKTMQAGDKVVFKDVVNNGKGDCAVGIEVVSTL